MKCHYATKMVAKTLWLTNDPVWHLTEPIATQSTKSKHATEKK